MYFPLFVYNMEAQELKIKVREFLRVTDISNILAVDKVQRQFVDIYYQVTGRVVSCGGCVNNVAPALKELEAYTYSDINSNPFKLKDMNYILKPNIRVHISSLGMVLTSANCTDGNAKALLGENPLHADKFEKLPPGWEAESKAFYNKMTGAGEPTKAVKQESASTTEVAKSTQAEESEELPAEPAKATEEAPAKPVKVIEEANRKPGGLINFKGSNKGKGKGR